MTDHIPHSSQLGTIKQCREAVKQNHDNIGAALGEFTDNSTDHGKAKNVLIKLTESSIIHVDNGKFDPERFATACEKTKRPEIKSKYADILGKIGRYNFGLTDAFWILGNLSTLMSVINDVTMVQEHDWEDTDLKNQINTKVREANDHEKIKFKELMRENNPEWKDGDYGTVIECKSLRKGNNTTTAYRQIINFYRGLYTTDYKNPADIKITFDQDEEIIKPIDLDQYLVGDFERKTYTNHMKDGKETFTTDCNSIADDDICYQFETIAGSLDLAGIAEEDKIYGAKKGTGYHVGSRLYRGGRRVSPPEALKFGLNDKSFCRAKNLRITYLLPAGDKGVDSAFKVSTLKSIGEGTYARLKDGAALKVEIKNLNITTKKKHDRILRDGRDNIANELTKGLPNTKEEIANEIATLEGGIQDDGVIYNDKKYTKKKNPKVFKAYHKRVKDLRDVQNGRDEKKRTEMLVFANARDNEDHFEIIYKYMMHVKKIKHEEMARFKVIEAEMYSRELSQ